MHKTIHTDWADSIVQPTPDIEIVGPKDNGRIKESLSLANAA